MKYRAYEHKLLEHKDVTRSWTLTKIIIKNDEEDNTNFIEQRKSERLKGKAKIDYLKMNKGEDISTTDQNSEVAQHISK